MEKQISHHDLVDSELSISKYFSNKLLLRTALTHPSFVEQYQRKLSSFEHLEFLGDAVMQFVVYEHMYHKMNQFKQSGTKYCWDQAAGYLLSNKHLKQVSTDLKLQDYILFGQERGIIMIAKLLGDVFEALVGAIFLDKGIQGARDFVVEYCVPRSDEEWIDLLEQNLHAPERIQSYQFIPPCKLCAADDLMRMEQDIGYVFEHKHLLQCAMTGHYVNKGVDGTIQGADGNLHCGCNGRLRSLGISILRFVVTEHLFLSYPSIEEGTLSLSIHMIMDKDDTCMTKGTQLSKVQEYMTISGPDDPQFPVKRDTCNAMLALFAAAYIDAGGFITYRSQEPAHTPVPDYLVPYQSLRHDVGSKLIDRFVLSIFRHYTRMHPTHVGWPPKHALQHLTQITFHNTKPSYSSRMNEDGTNTVLVHNHEGVLIGKGTSKVYKEAEEIAVRDGITYCELFLVQA
ncbi:hypothetical protein AKO1_005993 [Acrasis kona]|uniref:RNase III domain-containing protein n=1 Tax=Acrasis kona TaxID=1008807 RepID=A0AAW2YHN3_9EUKA